MLVDGKVQVRSGDPHNLQLGERSELQVALELGLNIWYGLYGLIPNRCLVPPGGRCPKMYL